MNLKINILKNIFENFAIELTKFTGGTTAFIIALSLVIIWCISGPFFNYSEGWQLVINTGTTIMTFLMVFLIQRAQNKDALAFQLKLNELIAAVKGASNRLIDAENLTENDLEKFKKHYKRLSELYKQEEDIQQSHSIEEAGKIIKEAKSLDEEGEKIDEKAKNKKLK